MNLTYLSNLFGGYFPSMHRVLHLISKTYTCKDTLDFVIHVTDLQSISMYL